MVLLALILRPADPAVAQDRLAIAGVELPGVCTLKETTGIPCPGCGLTRSWVAAMHGDLAGSWAFHRVGWLLLAYAWLQILRHGLWLAVPKLRRPLAPWGRRLDRGAILLAVVLVVAWVPTLLGHFLR